MKVLIAVASCFILAGCRHHEFTSQREAFFMRNPNLKTNYLVFDATSPGSELRFADRILGSKLTLIKGMGEQPTLADQTPYYFGLNARIHENHDALVSFIRKIEEVFDPNRDELFYYNFRDGKGGEDGWLILRNGGLYRKFPVAIAAPESSKRNAGD